MIGGTVGLSGGGGGGGAALGRAAGPAVAHSLPSTGGEQARKLSAERKQSSSGSHSGIIPEVVSVEWFAALGNFNRQSPTAGSGHARGGPHTTAVTVSPKAAAKGEAGKGLKWLGRVLSSNVTLKFKDAAQEDEYRRQELEARLLAWRLALACMALAVMVEVAAVVSQADDAQGLVAVAIVCGLSAVVCFAVSLISNDAGFISKTLLWDCTTAVSAVALVVIFAIIAPLSAASAGESESDAPWDAYVALVALPQATLAANPVAWYLACPVSVLGTLALVLLTGYGKGAFLWILLVAVAATISARSGELVKRAKYMDEDKSTDAAGVRPLAHAASGRPLSSRYEEEKGEDIRPPFADDGAAAAGPPLKSKAGGDSDEMVAFVCQELRNPLHGVVGLLTALEESDDLSGADAVDVASALEASRQMMRVLTDIAELNNLHFGRDVRLFPEWTDVVELSKGCAVDARFVADAAVEIRVDANDPPVPECFVDPSRLRQILACGVGHAVDATVVGTIVIDCSVRERTLRISVTDTGCGSPPDMEQETLPALSDLMKASNDDAVKLAASAGLGTGLAMLLAQAMGGHVTVGNRQDGITGTRFMLTLPVTTRPAVGTALSPSISGFESLLPTSVARGASGGGASGRYAGKGEALSRGASGGAGGAAVIDTVDVDDETDSTHAKGSSSDGDEDTNPVAAMNPGDTPAHGERSDRSAVALD